MEYKYILGILYLLYAIIKITVGLALMFLPFDIIAKTPVLKIFIKETSDKTLAGRFYEYVLLIFGIFSLVEGLALLDILPFYIAKYFESKWVEYIVFIVLGLLLTVFYILVLYTDLPISKNKTDNQHYKIFGLGGGLSFLIMPLIWEAFAYIVPAFDTLSREIKAAIIVGIVIVLTIIVDLIYVYLHKKEKTIVQVLPQNYQQNIQAVEEVKQILSNKISPAVSKTVHYKF